jgi:hypothetical protein
MRQDTLKKIKRLKRGQLGAFLDKHFAGSDD